MMTPPPCGVPVGERLPTSVGMAAGRSPAPARSPGHPAIQLPIDRRPSVLERLPGTQHREPGEDRGTEYRTRCVAPAPVVRMAATPPAPRLNLPLPAASPRTMKIMISGWSINDLAGVHPGAQPAAAEPAGRARAAQRGRCDPADHGTWGRASGTSCSCYCRNRTPVPYNGWHGQRAPGVSDDY